MMPKMKIYAFWVLTVFLFGCTSLSVPVVYRAGETEKSWEYTEVLCMERGIEYPLPDGRHELQVVEQADSECSKCLACRDVAGRMIPLVEGERTFGYAVCRNTPQYLLVFDNFASKQNRVLLYMLLSSRPVLCYNAELDAHSDLRVIWRVASWSQEGILLVGVGEDASVVYRMLPLE